VVSATDVSTAAAVVSTKELVATAVVVTPAVVVAPLLASCPHELAVIVSTAARQSTVVRSIVASSCLRGE
jgi:hypothetical protein